MLRSLLCKKTSKTDNQLTQDVESTGAFRMPSIGTSISFKCTRAFNFAKCEQTVNISVFLTFFKERTILNIV